MGSHRSSPPCSGLELSICILALVRLDGVTTFLVLLPSRVVLDTNRQYILISSQMSSRTAPLTSPGTLSTPRAGHPGLHPIAEKVKEQISPGERLEQGLENVTPYLQNQGGFVYAVLIRNRVFLGQFSCPCLFVNVSLTELEQAENGGIYYRPHL